jgi:hypothetical protein
MVKKLATAEKAIVRTGAFLALDLEEAVGSVIQLSGETVSVEIAKKIVRIV